MNKHTPGPWHLDPDCGNQTVNGPDGFMIADCAIFSLKKGAPSKERCEANARLISATHELLAALIELRDFYTDITKTPAIAANAAIAKARGE